MIEEPYIKIPTRLLEDESISDGEFRLLTYLINLRNMKKGKFIVSQETMIDRLKVSESQLKRRLKNLHNKGYITIEKRGKYNLYDIKDNPSETKTKGKVTSTGRNKNVIPSGTKNEDYRMQLEAMYNAQIEDRRKQDIEASERQCMEINEIRKQNKEFIW